MILQGFTREYCLKQHVQLEPTKHTFPRRHPGRNVKRPNYAKEKISLMLGTVKDLFPEKD